MYLYYLPIQCILLKYIVIVYMQDRNFSLKFLKVEQEFLYFEHKNDECPVSILNFFSVTALSIWLKNNYQTVSTP